jgi:hypothetical protein
MCIVECCGVDRLDVPRMRSWRVIQFVAQHQQSQPHYKEGACVCVQVNEGGERHAFGLTGRTGCVPHGSNTYEDHATKGWGVGISF